MTKFRVYSNAAFWGTFEGDSAADAIRAAAIAHGAVDVDALTAETYDEALSYAKSAMIRSLSADMSDDPAARREEIAKIEAALAKTYSDTIDLDAWIDAATAEAKIGL